MHLQVSNHIHLIVQDFFKALVHILQLTIFGILWFVLIKLSFLISATNLDLGALFFTCSGGLDPLVSLIFNMNCLPWYVERSDILGKVNAHISAILSHGHFFIAHLWVLIINNVLKLHINHSFIRYSEGSLISLLDAWLVNDLINPLIQALEQVSLRLLVNEFLS